MSENKQQIPNQEQINPINLKPNPSQQSHIPLDQLQNENTQKPPQINQNIIDKSQQVQENQNQQKKSSSDNEPNGNNQQSQNQQDDQNQRSSNLDDYKSEDDDDPVEDSNQKSDNKDQEEGRSDQDLKKQQPSGKKCFNKLCNSKKIYKKLRSKVQHAKYRFFCRQCYQSYYNNDFCEFCQQIYSSTANSDDDDQWIGCDSCTRWNHIDCEKKFRNRNINQIRDESTQYLCLTCSYKPSKKQGVDGIAKKKEQVNQEQKLMKPNPEISREQRTQIFSKKLEALPSLQYFLQNYNFRLWINENLIKDDLQTLRQSSRKNQDESRKNKKVKTE